MKLNKTKIGILGGSFDPAHKGHLAISKEAKKRFELKNIIWAITKKNPFKNQSKTSVTERIKFCKKIIGNNSFIKVRFYENKINSNKTIDLINHLKKSIGKIMPFVDESGKFTIILPSGTAYGKDGNSNFPVIPGNSVLIFEIHLLKIRK